MNSTNVNAILLLWQIYGCLQKKLSLPHNHTYLTGALFSKLAYSRFYLDQYLKNHTTVYFLEIEYAMQFISKSFKNIESIRPFKTSRHLKVEVFE